MKTRRSFTLALLGLIAVAVVALAVSGVDAGFVFNRLSENRAVLIDMADRYGVLIGAAFVVLYMVGTALSVPGGAFLTIAGGFLFGTWLGGAYVVIGATLGATLLFLIAKTALGDALRARAGPALKRMEAGFNRNALSYMFVLRLIPLFPFWLVNLVPAFLGVSLRVYLIGTFFGIMPGTFVFASIGNGFDVFFRACDAAKAARPELPCEAPGLGQFIAEPEIIGPLVALAVLSLIPVLYKKIRPPV